MTLLWKIAAMMPSGWRTLLTYCTLKSLNFKERMFLPSRMPAACVMSLTLVLPDSPDRFYQTVLRDQRAIDKNAVFSRSGLKEKEDAGWPIPQSFHCFTRPSLLHVASLVCWGLPVWRIAQLPWQKGILICMPGPLPAIGFRVMAGL